MNLRLRFVVAAVGLAVLICAGMPSRLLGEPIAPGVGERTVNFSGTRIVVYTYRPACAEPKLLLVFHGMNRNAAGYRDSTKWLGDTLCMIVVAPEFDKERFPGWSYQHGGIVDKGKVRPSNAWTVYYAPLLVKWAQMKESRPLDVFMIGHSGGGQFLSRVAAYLPTVAKRIVVANPSTHVFPNLEPAPYGFGGVYPQDEADANLRRYLETPVTIFLGKEDTGDKSRDDRDAARKQGVTRLERGRNAFAAGQALAQARGWTFNWRLVELPGVGHSARKMFSAQEAVEALRP